VLRPPVETTRDKEPFARLRVLKVHWLDKDWRVSPKSSAIASPEEHQPLLRDLAATANYLLFRRWNQSPTALFVS